ncbi:hypothetical protein LZD49_07230 [Dyadobacter sp. CY261]|uniref:hypothetical protein n=1 Tax=Dyadobacter sp. CY261 TaxID=2907203 RepID=UPI001F24C52E|nr:hypothetical protein [Dyadobacter sp. CY261]MCF0070258.1 hypothetical protein [Dyadobacter sp. CY261]
MKNAKLDITVQSAQSAFNAGNSDQKELLKKLFPDHNFQQKITDRVRSYEDACDIVGIVPHTIENFSDVPDVDRQSTFAYHQLTIIARALNEGWAPDWKNHNQPKYYGWFEHAAGGSGFSFCVSACVFSLSYVGSRLVFRSSELAEYAGKTFIEIYNSYLL